MYGGRNMGCKYLFHPSPCVWVGRVLFQLQYFHVLAELVKTYVLQYINTCVAILYTFVPHDSVLLQDYEVCS